MQKGLESADLIADRFAATGRVECTARIAAHERKTLFRKMLLAPHGISWHRTASLGFAWGLSFLTERAQVVVSHAHRFPRSFFALALEHRESSSLVKPASLPPLRSVVIGRHVSGHSVRHSRACRKRLTTLRHGAGAGLQPVCVRVRIFSCLRRRMRRRWTSRPSSDRFARCHASCSPQRLYCHLLTRVRSVGQAQWT